MDGYQNSQGGRRPAGPRPPRPAAEPAGTWRCETGISTRHLSFVETGRSRPSPGLVLRLCEVLGVPPREADGVLLAAGHAPAHRETPLEAPAMAEVLAALRLILARHDPLPAVAFDAGLGHRDVQPGLWRRARCLPGRRGGAGGGAGPLPRLALLPAPRPNLLRLLCHPAGARRFIGNWPEVARALLDRVQREARLPSADPGRGAPPIEEALAQPGWRALMRASRPPGRRGAPGGAGRDAGPEADALPDHDRHPGHRPGPDAARVADRDLPPRLTPQQ